MKKVPKDALVSDLIGYSLKSKKPVPMFNALLSQLNTLPANRYSPPVSGWVEINGIIYLSFENPATYPMSIYMPMAGGYWDGYIYNLGVQPPPKPAEPNFPTLLPKLGIGTLAIAGIAAILILR